MVIWRSSLESVVIMNFWSNKTVLITGHNGFKGSWLTLWLHKLGANVIGYSNEPPSVPNLYSLLDLEHKVVSILGDVRNEELLSTVIEQYQPEIVFHMAAQSLVRKSYLEPIETFDTNVMGTVKLLNSIRNSNNVKVVINVTSDKCYENKEWVWGYRENDPFGGYDPYSASKGCAEIVTNAFRQSFFNDLGIQLASVRAGNVIGGGDWAEDRLIPDIIRGCISGQLPIIRNPFAIRPWQHVLEPLRGYMMLAEEMWNSKNRFSDGWNFGPDDENVLNVGDISQRILDLWGTNLDWGFDYSDKPYEAQLLRLDCTKAKTELGWKPLLNIKETLELTVIAYKQSIAENSLNEIINYQIDSYMEKGANLNERKNMSIL